MFRQDLAGHHSPAGELVEVLAGLNTPVHLPDDSHDDGDDDDDDDDDYSRCY